MLHKDPRLRPDMSTVEQLVALPDLWRLKADEGGQDSLAAATREYLAELDRDVQRREQELDRTTPSGSWWTEQASRGGGSWWLSPPAQPE